MHDTQFLDQSPLYIQLMKTVYMAEDTLNEIVSPDRNEILSEYPIKGILFIY